MTHTASNQSRDYVYDIKIKFEPFMVEFHPDEDVATLPKLFNEQHINEVAEKVFLCDPAGNMFEVYVEKLYDEAYFSEGWSVLGNFYGLNKGGWVRLVFVACDLFLIQLRNRLDQPCNYPLPAKIHRLDQNVKTLDYPRADNVPVHYASICRQPALYQTLDKTLSHHDVTAGTLHISPQFCQVAFRKSETKILVFDEYGKNATCLVEFSPCQPNRSGITQGWDLFCSEKAYFDGLRVQLAVPCASPTIMLITVQSLFL